MTSDWVNKVRTMPIVLLWCPLLLAACSNIPTQQGYAEHMQYWQGKDANHLLAELGVPTRTMTMPNGNTLYTYIRTLTKRYPYYQKRFYEPGGRITYTENGQTKTIGPPGHWVSDGLSGGESVYYSCTTNFVIDVKTQLVQSVTFEGNNCVAVPRNP